MGRVTPRSVLRAAARQHPDLVKEMPSTFAGVTVPPKATKKTGAGDDKKKHKFNAQPTVVDGIRFDSKGEAECYEWLLRFHPKKAIKLQVSFPLPGGVFYVADFVVNVLNPDGFGEILIVEYKGHETPEWRIKKKQFEELYRRRIIVIKRPREAARTAPMVANERLPVRGNGA